MSCKTCRQLLSDALTLAVRAKKMDAVQRRDGQLAASRDPEGWVESGTWDRHAARHNALHPHVPLANACAPSNAPWFEDQYNKDLDAWEAKARKHLLDANCENRP